MKRWLVSVVVCLGWLCCGGEETNLVAGLSPKLRSFLASHPAALGVLTNACSSAFRTNSVAIRYFYSEDESQPRAYHFYPHLARMPDVELCVRENQEPLDEFTSILFELINSKNQPRFEEILDRAAAGSIQRREFAMAVIRIEFEADLAVREVLRGMKLTSKEKRESYLYNRLVNCPTNFEEFLVYQRKVSPKRDQVKEYETAYDALTEKLKR